MDRIALKFAAVTLGTLALAACVTPAQELANSASEGRPPDYVVEECGRAISELRPLYDAEANNGAVDIRTPGLEGRAQVMGCDPRKYQQ